MSDDHPYAQSPRDPLEHPRAGWEESFREMHARGDDALPWPDDDTGLSWDDEEWEW